MATNSRKYRYLCVNAGSSSLKLALYLIGSDNCEVRLETASASGIGLPEARIDGAEYHGHPSLENHHVALHALLQTIDIAGLDAVGHRIVHGGEHTQPVRITHTLRAQLEKLVPLAPLHLPASLAGIDAISAQLPGLTQIACFDTAFHHTLPEQARCLALPQHYTARGIRRYGFHGLSYEYIVRQLGERARGRIIIAHLGNGVSLSALLDGRSIDTTMGLTPSGGVMMGTRSGDLDPGVVLYLLREEGLDMARLEHVLDQESGLLGVSGITSDMAQLLQCDEADARQAVHVFAYQVRKAIGALTAALGGLERLVFTGGIGEHGAAVREQICHDLGHLGIRLDNTANQAHAPVISVTDARCAVEVIPTDENAMIAHHVHGVLNTDTR